MRYGSAIAVGMVILAGVGTSRADFKYTQQSKVTGGSLAGITKKLGVFSKSARQANEPQSTTTMVRGNRMRTEHSTGTIEIIDLDARRFIHIDSAKKTYNVETFDQLKQQIAQTQAKATQEETHTTAKQDDKSNVTVVPKFDMRATGATHDVIGLPSKEMTMRIDLKFQSTDPKTEADLEKSNATTWMTSDSWYGTVPGYEELRAFYMKMAKEMNWLPESMGMGAGNPQMAQAMTEFRKNSIKMDGMPLLEYTSFGMSAQGQDSSVEAQQNTQADASKNNPPTSASDAIAKGLGGLFAKKKQKQADSENTAAANSNVPPPPPPVPGSLMDTTIEVTSYSKDSLDAALFEVPAGYTQVQPGSNDK